MPNFSQGHMHSASWTGSRQSEVTLVGKGVVKEYMICLACVFHCYPTVSGQCEANPEVRADKEADDSSECMDAPAPAPKSDPPVAEPKRAELVAESSDEELEMCGDAFAEMEDALDNL